MMIRRRKGGGEEDGRGGMEGQKGVRSLRGKEREAEDREGKKKGEGRKMEEEGWKDRKG